MCISYLFKRSNTFTVPKTQYMQMSYKWCSRSHTARLWKRSTGPILRITCSILIIWTRQMDPVCMLKSEKCDSSL